MFGPSDGGDIQHTVADIPQYLSAAPQKSLTSKGQADTRAMPMEQCGAEVMFEIPDATTEGGLVNANGGASLSETSVLGRSHEIAKVTKLESMYRQLDHSHRHACTRTLSATMIM